MVCNRRGTSGLFYGIPLWLASGMIVARGVGHLSSVSTVPLLTLGAVTGIFLWIRGAWWSFLPTWGIVGILVWNLGLSFHTQPVIYHHVQDARIFGKVYRVRLLQRKDRWNKVSLVLKEARINHWSAHVGVRVSGLTKREIHRGDLVWLYADLFPLHRDHLLYPVSSAEWGRMHGIGGSGYARSFVHGWSGTTWRGRLEQKISQALVAARFHGAERAIALDLLSGDRGLLFPKLLRTYRRAGIAHVLAISGIHFAILGWALTMLFRILLQSIPIGRRLDLRWGMVPTVLILGVFALFVGGYASVFRAYGMLFLLFWGHLLGYVGNARRRLLLVVILLLLLQPFQISNVSFLLSVYATGGLIFLARWHGKMGKLGFFLLSLPVVTLVMLPITWHFFQTFHPWTLLGNLVGIPLLTFGVMPALLVAFVGIGAGLTPLLWPLRWTLILMNTWAGWVSNLPQSTLYLPPLSTPAYAVCMLGYAWAFCYPERYKLPLTLTLLVLCLQVFWPHPPPPIILGRQVILRPTKARIYRAYCVRRWTQSLKRYSKAVARRFHGTMVEDNDPHLCPEILARQRQAHATQLPWKARLPAP